MAGAVLLLVTGAIALGVRVGARHRHNRLARGARTVTVTAPPTVELAGAETLFANLVGLLRPAWARLRYGQPHIGFEYLFTRTGLTLRLWVPGSVPPGMVERAVAAAWPGARTTTATASAPIPTTTPPGTITEVAGGELRLARLEALPLRIQFSHDPIRTLLGAAAGLGVRERAVVQVLARPVTGRRLRRARRAARSLRAGTSPRLASQLLDLITPHPIQRQARRPGSARPVDRQTTMVTSAEDRAIITKERSPQYETRVRYAVAALVDADSPGDDRTAVHQHLRGRAHALASAFAPFSDHNRYRRRRLRAPLTTLADRRIARGDLLSIAELAALAHIPTDADAPGLVRAGAQAVPPPPGITTGGAETKAIGRTDSGDAHPVALRVADARHHVHILGATGSGKSELLARMIVGDAEAGRGLVVIDPKGDLISDILKRLPEEAGPRVVLLDADSRTRPPVLNPLEGDDTARVVDNLVSIFSRIYAAAWGPRSDDILRSGLLTLRAQPGVPTLADLPKLLTVPAFRQRALAHVHDEVLAGFWQWYDELSDASRAQVIAPLMNKLRGLLLRPFVRAALAGGRSTFDMDTVLDGGICLVRLGKDALGIDTARLIGSLFVARTWQAATRRARTPERDRHDAGLYIDECHNFLNLAYPLEDMLAEARGYRLSMTLAHQYLRQLPPELAEGISSNARSKIHFSCSPEDARILARHTLPRINEHDLSHLGAFHVAARLVLRGEEAPAFTAVTEKLPPPVPGRARAIRTAALRNTTVLTSIKTAATSMSSPEAITADPRHAIY